MSKRESNSVRVLLRIPVFRRLWAAVAISSLGDWLGLLATTSMAAYLTKDSSNLVQGAAVSGVLITRLLPDLLLAPVAGALVDRFDRRKVAIVCDVAAAGLYLSIVIGGNLTWLLIAQFLVEAVGLFGTPAKQTLWVNIVPRERLAVANQLNYVSVYGMVPVAALVFALLSTVSQFFGAPVDPAASTGALISGTSRASIDIALVLDSLTYLFSAAMIYFSRHLIPAFVGERTTNRGIFSLVREGISFIKNSRIMRAIYIGILGAFGAGGLVAGVAQAYVATLGAGSAGYGILFGTVFTGLALGMLVGPKVLPTVPRRMVFTLSIGLAGVCLVIMGMLQDFLGAVLASAIMGLFAGIAWITGFTMIGQEVADQLRGRVFAFVMSSVRLVLLGTIALGPILAGALGSHLVTVGSFQMYLSGPAIVLLVGGLIAVLVSVYAGRQVGGLAGSVLRRVFGRRRDALLEDDDRPGVLIAVEGARPADVDRYAEALSDYLSAAEWLVDTQCAPVSVGRPARIEVSPGRTVDAPSAALRSIADLADLAADRLRPALDQGSVVVCQGYVDAVVVRFGAQGGLDEGRILRMAQWATGGLRPDLTLLVDQVPVHLVGPDPAESESDSDSATVTPALTDPARADPPRTEPARTEQTPTSSAPTQPAPTQPAPAQAAPADGEESPVDPAQAYRDLAASAPERYLVVGPLAPDSGDLPAEVAARVDSTLRVRVPVKAGVRAA
jgi:dTMP kinase